MTTDAEYGTDIGGYLDLDPADIMVSGRRCLSEALARRLQTPRGRLIGDPEYGLDVVGYLNDDITPLDIAEMQSAIASECAKDERVATASAVVTMNASGGMTVDLTITDAVGPFSLVLAVSAVTVTILAVPT